MSNSYEIEIVKTQSGALDLDYYRAEANRMRSECLKDMLIASIRGIKNLFTVKKDLSSLTVNRVSC